jgi:hypothetical protein
MTFKEKMLDYIVSTVLSNFLKALKPDEIRIVLDRWIDVVEEAIERSDNEFDDHLLPVLKFVRDFFAIPDLPDIG